jgi:hypothetical protein
MLRCSLFGHRWSYDAHFVVEPPKGRRMLEKALLYESCTRCGIVQMQDSTMEELNRRIRRSRELAWKPQ